MNPGHANPDDTSPGNAKPGNANPGGLSPNGLEPYGVAAGIHRVVRALAPAGLRENAAELFEDGRQIIHAGGDRGLTGETGGLLEKCDQIMDSHDIGQGSADRHLGLAEPGMKVVHSRLVVLDNQLGFDLIDQQGRQLIGGRERLTDLSLRDAD